jgi:hypothetical protein
LTGCNIEVGTIGLYDSIIVHHYYGYNPSQAAGLAFSILFGISFCELARISILSGPFSTCSGAKGLLSQFFTSLKVYTIGSGGVWLSSVLEL